MTPLAQTKAIHEDLTKALDEIAAKYGLQKAKFNSLKYDDNGFTATLNVVFAGGESKEMAKLRAHTRIYGLKEDVCGAEIMYSNGRYKLMGMRNTKVLLEQNGKSYNAPIDAVVNSIKHYHPEFCL